VGISFRRFSVNRYDPQPLLLAKGVFPVKRTLIVAVLSLFVFSSISDAQRRPRGGSASSSNPGGGKISVPCPASLNDITDCPDTGCGPSLDPLLNKQKNIRSDDQTAEAKTIQELKDLPDPVSGYKIGDPRDKLKDLGEGKKITVMAYALVARKGGGESCNCKLLSVADTDNHIVLVDPSVKSPTLAKDEDDSETAEFAPRVRLDHPNLSRAKLQPLITAGGGKLLVRMTGLLMFDSEHSLGHHLKRHNNWEIHPVMRLEYCPKAKKCIAGSNANWKNIEQ
jgi:hypothetical protein